MTKNQIYHIITSQDSKKIIKNSHSYQSVVTENVRFKGKLPKRSRIKGEWYDAGKLSNDQKLADSSKVSTGESECTNDGSRRPRNKPVIWKD